MDVPLISDENPMGLLDSQRNMVDVRATSHMRLRARDPKHCHWWKRRSGGPSSLPSHFAWGTTNGVCIRVQDGCKDYMDSFLHGIEWIMSHGYLDWFLETTSWRWTSTQNQETMAFRTLTAVGEFLSFFLFYHVWGHAWIEFHGNSIWWRIQSHMTSHYTWGSVTALNDFECVLGRPLDTFFWAPTIPWSRHLGLFVKRP